VCVWMIDCDSSVALWKQILCGRISIRIYCYVIRVSEL
jgi:hypothetical protein